MKKSVLYTLAFTLLTTCLFSCGSTSKNGVSLEKNQPKFQSEDHTDNYVDDNYKNYYQLLVYSFFDSNGDGIGDIKGVIEKFDYINDGNRNSKKSLGYDGIYFLPIFPSPTYHKYDATDYYSIDSKYGTLDDFDELIKIANERGVDIILDLAVNHTSNQHPWFKQAISDIKKVDSYNKETMGPTEEDMEKYPSLRYYNFVHHQVDSDDFTPRGNYHTVSGTKWSYEGQFYDGMPDLNLDQQVVKDEIKNIMKFWLDRGVKGFRLDAVQHYFDNDKQKSYDFINQIADWGKELTDGKGCYLCGEGPWSDTVDSYYKNTHDVSYLNFNYGAPDGKGKLNNVLTNSALYNKKIETLTKEKKEIIYSVPTDTNSKAFDILNDGAAFATRCAADYFRAIVENWDKKMYEANENAIDTNFGTNHDTIRAINLMSGQFDEKDYQTACKFYWGLNNTLSGYTFNYYGEEIGMRAGDQSIEQNKDPNKRHPMYWSKTNTKGMTNYAPGGSPTDQYLEPADKQMKDSNSLWNFMRELNRAKACFPEIARGKQKFVKVGSTYTVMEKSYNDSKIYLLYNFSNKASSINLNELGLEEVPTEIKYSLTSSVSYYSKLTAETINVPAYSITII